MNWELVSQLLNVIHDVKDLPKLKKLGDMASAELEALAAPESKPVIIPKTEPVEEIKRV
jgi:hypothetical protein